MILNLIWNFRLLIPTQVKSLKQYFYPCLGGILGVISVATHFFAREFCWINWFSDSAALTTWGELNWLKIVNETQKTKTAKLIKTSFT